MAKKKRSQQSEAAEDAITSLPPATPTAMSASSTASSAKASKAADPSTSALTICRNKHWRYISCFHGPWLQLPPEVLESLAHSNYLSPQPHPIDPAVFYDLVKIRKAVDEATNLAVRATSGLTSSALSSSQQAGNGLLGSAGIAALGLGYGGTGSTAKLSRERKHRMRELATQKLSQAYHLDEIATSVATMQSASTLEDVAQLVLQRNSTDNNAKYVHFFHEKIPSRMMAQCTSLDPLNEIIADQPTDGAPLRTRALTRIFKEDYIGAARDLTEGLAICRYMMAQHKAGKDQLVLARTLREEAERRGREWRQEVKVEEEDQPSSLETQLLFHRAGIYFTIACQHVNAALDGLEEAQQVRHNTAAVHEDEGGAEPLPLSAAEREAHRKRLEARKIVKTNAKRALRDYNSFLSHFDYTPGFPTELTAEILRHFGNGAPGNNNEFRSAAQQPPPETSSSALSSNSQMSGPLISRRKSSSSSAEQKNWSSLPPPEIYQLSALFSSTPPPNLPPYPAPTSTSLTAKATASESADACSAAAAAAAFADSHEAITYHPLLTDALHSMLLCHALLQTSPRELQRHAHNAARLARVCDGYPIFLAARSPARADWVEVLRRTNNWIGLQQSWEALCRPAPLPGHAMSNGNGELTKSGMQIRPETKAQKRERLKHEAILEALADERVVDEESFQRAIRARERRAREDEEAEAKMAAHEFSSNNEGSGSPAEKNSIPSPKRWAQEKEYPISTERAEAITRWVREAPLSVEGGKKKGTKKGKARKKVVNGQAGVLEDSVGTLSVQHDEEADRVEEEIDE